MQEIIRLLHLNDLHSHFEAFPKLQRFFENASQNQDEEVIKLDIGDNIDRSHPLSDATKGKANVQLMNQLGIDFATIGNNEGIGLSKEDLNQVYDEANFEVILGNLEDNHQRPKWASPYAIYRTKKGTTIAFLAYTFPYYWTYEPNGWQVTDPIEALKRDLQLPEVTSADIRILLSHLGITVDERITEEVDNIDLIIGSHTHHVFEDGACLNGTYLAAAGKYGQYVGNISMVLENHRLQEIEIIAHETSHFPSLPSDQEAIQALLNEGERLLDDQSILTLAEPLNQEKTLDLVMEAMMDYAHADTCLINTGLLVHPLDQRITLKSLQKSLPHQMRLARFELSKESFEKICFEIWGQADLLKNQEIRGMGFRGKQFGGLCSRGFAYKNGKIVYNETVMGKSDKISLVLVDQYFFASYFPSVKQELPTLLFPDLLREVLEKYLKNEKMIGKESNEKGNFTRNV
ncbi:metallophosphatase [Streptococcus uberis]|nr:metallophosphatase [Streptococcus uberis]MCK1207687.1 metallophosphatase [Streptococcus uberis]